MKGMGTELLARVRAASGPVAVGILEHKSYQHEAAALIWDLAYDRPVGRLSTALTRK